MAGMEDPLTDLPPPSRFDPRELFDLHASSHPPPSLVWTPHAHHHLRDGKLSPHLLFLAICKISRHLLHHLPSKTLLASITLPGISISDCPLSPTPQDSACYLYCLQDNPNLVLVTVQYDVPAERSFLWVKTLFRAIVPGRVIVAAGLQTQSFRGRLSPDDPMLFQLTTDAQRSEDGDQAPIAEYFPSGSLVDGLAAALISHCQARGMKGRLLVLWGEGDPSFLKLLASVFRALVKREGDQELDFSDGIHSYVGKRAAKNSHLYL